MWRGFFGNKYNSYIDAARNAKVTCLWENCNETEEEKILEAYFERTLNPLERLLNVFWTHSNI